MSNEIKRATGLLVIEVVNSNPNGDPDRESDPRQRPNGCGEISPVSFKRKLRELLDDHDAPFFKILPETSVYKGYKQDKIEMRGDRAEMSDFPLYLNTVAGGLDRRDQTIGGFSFVVKIYAVPVVEIIG